jgi:hypothetical protein
VLQWFVQPIVWYLTCYLLKHPPFFGVLRSLSWFFVQLSFILLSIQSPCIDTSYHQWHAIIHVWSVVRGFDCGEELAPDESVMMHMSCNVGGYSNKVLRPSIRSLLLRHSELKHRHLSIKRNFFLVSRASWAVYLIHCYIIQRSNTRGPGE